MALPDYAKVASGTQIVWGPASATTNFIVTHAMTLNNMATTTGWMGAYADLGALWDQDHSIQMLILPNAAPTALATVELYLAWSHDATNWVGKADGTNAVWPATPTSAANNLRQLGSPVNIFPLLIDNSLQRGPLTTLSAMARYVQPILYLNTGTTIKNEGTPTDNTSRVVMTPLISSIQE